MQAVAALLTDEPQAIHGLACQVYGVDQWEDLTRAQVEAVRRACKRLAELDRAELTRLSTSRVRPNHDPCGGRGRYPSYLTARTPRSAEEREAAEQRRLAAARAMHERLARRAR